MGKPRDRIQVRSLLDDGLHIRRARTGFHFRHPLVIGAGHVVQLKREVVVRQAGKPGGEMVNRVVRNRDRTVAAGIGHRQRVVGVDFFRCVQVHKQGLAFVRFDSAAIVIQNKFRIDQLAMVLQQPVSAIRLAAFFVGGEREDNVAVGDEAFLLHPDQRRDHDRVAVFHVLGAAAVVVAVLLHELKRVGGPVFAAGFDYVEMSDQKKRLVLAGTVQPDD